MFVTFQTFHNAHRGGMVCAHTLLSTFGMDLCFSFLGRVLCSPRIPTHFVLVRTKMNAAKIDSVCFCFIWSLCLAIGISIESKNHEPSKFVRIHKVTDPNRQFCKTKARNETNGFMIQAFLNNKQR